MNAFRDISQILSGKREIRGGAFHQRKMRFKCFIELIRYGAKRRMLATRLFKRLVENRKFDLRDAFLRFVFNVKNRFTSKKPSRTISAFERSTDEHSMIRGSPFLVEDHSSAIKPRRPSEQRSMFIDKQDAFFHEPARSTAGFNKAATMGGTEGKSYADKLLEAFKVPDKALETFGKGEKVWNNKPPLKTLKRTKKKSAKNASKSRSKSKSLFTSKHSTKKHSLTNSSLLKELVAKELASLMSKDSKEKTKRLNQRLEETQKNHW